MQNSKIRLNSTKLDKKIFNFDLSSLGFAPSIVRTYQNAWHKLQLTFISGQSRSNESTLSAPLVSTGFLLVERQAHTLNNI